MGQLLVYGLLAIVLAGGLFLLATRFLPAGEQIAPPLRDEPPWELPAERMLRPDDVDSVRLPVALRGYRFAETDILLDRLAGELRSRDLEIARLRGQHDPAPAHQPAHQPASKPASKPAPQPLAPLTFAEQSFAKPEAHQETPVAADPEPPTDTPVPRETWAPPPGNADADAPQPPPFDDEEQPVTGSPSDDDRR